MTQARHRVIQCAGRLLLCLLACSPAFAQRTEVGRFSAGDLAGWEEKSFVGQTVYTLRAQGQQQVLQADSQAAASGLFRELQVDLERTPYLHWSWQVENLITGADERSKKGDDYPARIYVVFSGGLFFWRTKAINYVWSSSQPVGSTWPNAFTGNARMIAIRSGAAGLGQWFSERRDVRADYRLLFGSEPGEIAAVALMTDTDNTGASARASFGDIWFAAD